MSTEHIHLTVATVVERDGKFLFVEEDCRGEIVINQPAGHVENGESLANAAIRETFEETGWQVKLNAFISMYRWKHPETGHTYFRAAFSATPVEYIVDQVLDEGIIRAVWLSPNELHEQAQRIRSPLVLRCLQDHLNKVQYPLEILVDI